MKLLYQHFEFITRTKLEAANDEIRELKERIKEINGENKEKLRKVNDVWRQKLIETEEQSQVTKFTPRPIPRQRSKSR